MEKTTILKISLFSSYSPFSPRITNSQEIIENSFIILYFIDWLSEWVPKLLKVSPTPSSTVIYYSLEQDSKELYAAVQHRFYEDEYPKPDDVVMAKVTKYVLSVPSPVNWVAMPFLS